MSKSTPVPKPSIIVRQGDCLEELKTLGDKSVKLIVTSPPYADARKKTYGGVKPDDYVEWFLPISKELYRVLADDGSFILNIKEKVVGGERHTYVYDLVKELRNQGWLWTEEYLWHKRNATPGKWPNRFRDAWEHLYHFTKNKKFTMNQDAVKVPIGDWAGKRLANISENDKKRNEAATESGFGRTVGNWVGKETVYPDNVLYLSAEASNKNHSAVFPLSIPTWFVTLLSNEGDLVLDPFNGSGTTCIGAFKMGRNSVGIEKLEKYVDVSVKRIEKETGVKPTVVKPPKTETEED